MGVFWGRWAGGFKKGVNLHRKELIALPSASGHLTSYYWPFLFIGALLIHEKNVKYHPRPRFSFFFNFFLL